MGTRKRTLKESNEKNRLAVIENNKKTIQLSFRLKNPDYQKWESLKKALDMNNQIDLLRIMMKLTEARIKELQSD